MPSLPLLLTTWSPVAMVIGFVVLWGELRTTNVRVDALQKRMDEFNEDLREHRTETRENFRLLNDKLDRLTEALLSSKVAAG